MSGVGRAAVGSLACSALAWLGVLLLYTWWPAVLVWALDVVALGFALAALVVAVGSLVADPRKPLAWLALAVSSAFSDLARVAPAKLARRRVLITSRCADGRDEGCILRVGVDHLGWMCENCAVNNPVRESR